MLWKKEDQTLARMVLEKGSRRSPKIHLFTIPLLGRHQIENAATAYAALETIRALGVKLPMRAIYKGFRQVQWPGRFEFLRYRPAVVIDSAHNRDSTRRLRETIQEYLPGQPVVLLFGASEDKDISGMFAELKPITDQLIVTQTEHPRAIAIASLVELAHQAGMGFIEGLPLQAAIDRALELAGKQKAILAAGSIFLAAAVREEWMRRKTNEK